MAVGGIRRYTGAQMDLIVRGEDFARLIKNGVDGSKRKALCGIVPSHFVTAVRIPVPDAKDMIESAELGIRIPKELVSCPQISALFDILGRAAFRDEHSNGRDELFNNNNFRDLRGTVRSVSLLDGRKLAEGINEQNPDRFFRLPKSEEELLAIFDRLKKELTHEQLVEFEKYRIWVDQKNEYGLFPLCSLGNDHSFEDTSCSRGNDYAVLLVEHLRSGTRCKKSFGKAEG